MTKAQALNNYRWRIAYRNDVATWNRFLGPRDTYLVQWRNGDVDSVRPA